MIIIILILGLCLGSFINALVWRIHEQSKSLKKKKAKDLSILRGRSMCTKCKHTLGPLDLIPVISWLYLRGKCRYCGKDINEDPPTIELVTLLLFGLSYIYWPYVFNSEGIFLLVIWLITLVILIALTVYDIKWKLLPNRLVFPLIGLAVIQVLVELAFYHGGTRLLLGSIWGVLFSAGIFYGIYEVSKGKWIGGGDVKLAVALGLLIGGPSEAILMLFGASFIGSLIALPFIIRGKLNANSKVPFGPMLIAATAICYFFGPNIINWYTNLFIR